MATTQYIGARYVPLFAEPLDWSIDSVYEALTIVYYAGNSYTSRQAVPKGIDITNEKYWALTGNYNAQIEAYRKEVAAMDGRVTENAQNIADEVTRAVAQEAAIKTIIDNETSRATKAENQLSSDIAANEKNVSDLQTQVNELVSDTLRFKIKIRDAQDHSYLFSNPPAPAWDSVQGCCYTKDGKFAILLAPGLVYYRQNSTSYLNCCVIKEFDSDGVLIRTSSPIKCGHGNSITYNPITNELLIANNYQLVGDTDETRTESNLVTRVSYSNLSKIADFSVSSLGTVCNCISYDNKSKKLMAFNTDVFKCIYLDTSSYSAVGSAIEITGYQEFYNNTVLAFDESRRQAAVLFGDKIVCNTYMPNLFLFFNINDTSKIEKYVACEDMYTMEAEDFDIDADGNIILSFHKRFYNRSSTQEYVSNMFSIEESNLFTNYYNLNWADGSAVSAQRFIDVNPTTSNVIQNGSTNCPCKTVMQAYLEWLKCGSKQIAIRIQSGASGVIKAVRISYADLYIDDNSGGNVVFNNNMRLTAGRFNLDGLTFETQSDNDSVPFPFSTSQGNPSASQSTVNFYECTQKTSDATFGVSNCVYINTKTAFSVTQHNRNITNA